MRKALLGSTASLLTAIGAQAADLPIQPVVPYVPPAFHWTGLYLGGHVGIAGPERRWSDSTYGISFTSGTKDVFIGGGQAGANFQMDRIVLGVEWDLDYAHSNSNYDDGEFVAAIGKRILLTPNDRWLSTLSARFGVAFDRVLIYGKAGGGWIGNRSLTITNVTTGASIIRSDNMTSGWLVGAGVEWAFGEFFNGWTMRLEYDYLSFGTWSYTVPTTAPFLAGDTFTANRDVQMVKLGFNFLFNAPVRNKYY